MRDKNDRVIYVGKAKKLKSRVVTYFQDGAKSPKTQVLVSHIRDFDFLLTQTEAEALVLENNLIKKHGPKYNIMMRDDKSYPYVAVDRNEPYPRLQYVRRFKRKKNVDVFGPFVHGTNISEILRILVKSFRLRDCTLRDFKQRTEPCLLYQIKQCSAPCVDNISSEDYENDLKDALSFLKGKGKRGLSVLKKSMLEYAEAEEFERAAMLRDHIDSLEKFLEWSLQKNAEISGKELNLDIIGHFVGEEEIDLAIYIVRQGMLLGHKNFSLLIADCDDELEDSLRNFIFQYYNSGQDSLPSVVVLEKPDKLLSDAFSQVEEIKNIKVIEPTKNYQSLMSLAKDQAREHQQVRIANDDSVYKGLNKLKELLSLKERPVTLECYDIAVFQGKSPTAAQIVFVEGEAQRASYRHYHLQERPEGNNDFAMMEEVISRRLKHGHLPDVFIVDGGKGQVSSFEKILKEQDINVPVCGIAKSKMISGEYRFAKKEIQHSEERLVIPARLNPYYLSKCKSLFKILTQMRDEAHRFSRRLHHRQEKGRVIQSWLDQVEGIGPKTREKILTNLSYSQEELKGMEASLISKELGISLKIAKNILKVLN
jgi:excinuclease ABC subunit C